MSQTPPPPYGSSPPPYAAPPPRRRRPRKLWFVFGGALVLIAPIVFVGALFTVLRPLTQEDAVFAVRDTPVRLDLPADEERALFGSSGSGADCTATDGSGERLDLRPVSGDFSYNEWTAVARFDTGDGDVTIECTGQTATGERVRVAQLPSTGAFVAGIVAGVVGPLLLGSIGLVMLIVTGVLYATGAPRDGSA